KNRVDDLDKILRVSRARVAQLLLLHDGHRHFRQIIHHHIIERRLARRHLHLLDRRSRQIAPKALPRRYPYFFFHCGEENTITPKLVRAEPRAISSHSKTRFFREASAT